MTFGLGLVEVIGSFGKNNACGVVRKKSPMGMDSRQNKRAKRETNSRNKFHGVLLQENNREIKVFLEFHPYSLPNEIESLLYIFLALCIVSKASTVIFSFYRLFDY